MGTKRGTAAHLPDGHYAVPDPDEPDRLTFWRVTAGSLRDYPDGSRWRPMPPPRPAGVDGRMWRTERQDWYDTRYFPWLDQVVAAIDADSPHAAAMFRKHQGEADTAPPYVPPPRGPRPPRAPKPRRTTSGSAIQRAEQQLLASALHTAGRSLAEISEDLALPKTTVHRRVNGPATLADDMVSRALLLVRVGDLVTALATKDTLDQALAERVDRWIADLQAIRPYLVPRGGLGV